MKIIIFFYEMWWNRKIEMWVVWFERDVVSDAVW
jgi:hypothetical protein